MKIMEFDLKWIPMAQYKLILKQDGASWLRIILKPVLATKGWANGSYSPSLGQWALFTRFGFLAEPAFMDRHLIFL